MSEAYPEREPLKLVPPSAEILHRPAQKVLPAEIGTPELEGVIKGLLTMAKGQQGDPSRSTMVGLAAPQVGIDKRIIVVGVDADGLGHVSDFRVYINPLILDKSRKQLYGREGCYSTDRVCCRLWRAERVRLRALGRDGETILESHDGFSARIFQHETDHLKGILCPDQVTDDHDRLWVPKEQFGDFRHNWATWNQQCPPERWEAIKLGQPYQIK